MNTNFKKLAIAAATTAAMAGSMSAQAIITGIPGEANLIPLFYFCDNNISSSCTDALGGSKNTVVRITVPRSVGGDTTISFVTPNQTPQTVESVANKALDTVVTTIGGAVLNSTLDSSNLHWFFLDEQSRHRVNGVIPVSADYLTHIDAQDLLGSAYNNFSGYLVLTTQTASLGTKAADFAFAADAFLTVATPVTVPSALSIPVLPMSDGVDTTTYPTLTNNVIEKQNSATPLTFPVVSPLVTGTRTGVVGGNPIRVLDLPLAERGDFDNIIVFWNDRNGAVTQALAYDDIELNCSTNVTIPQQLNIFRSTDTDTRNTALGTIAMVDNYAASGAVTGFTTPNLPLCNNGINADDEGFVKLFITAPAAPTGATGAYASAVSFTLPVFAGEAEPAPYVPDAEDAQNGTLNATDAGTFASR